MEIGEKIKEEGARIKKEVRERTIGYVLAGLGFVAGLAWNEAIKSLIDYFIPITQDSVWVKLIYALAVTLIVVILSIYLVGLTKER